MFLSTKGLEDIVSRDLWEYLKDFMELKRKSLLNGYPLILGRPWLATIVAYIACSSRGMTISHGQSLEG